MADDATMVALGDQVRPGAEENKPNRPRIPVPPGWKPPAPGDTKDGMVTTTDDWKVLEGGKEMELVQLDDYKFPEEDDRKEKRQTDEDVAGEMGSAIKAARGLGGAGGPPMGDGQ